MWENRTYINLYAVTFFKVSLDFIIYFFKINFTFVILTNIKTNALYNQPGPKNNKALMRKVGHIKRVEQINITNLTFVYINLKFAFVKQILTTFFRI